MNFYKLESSAKATLHLVKQGNIGTFDKSLLSKLRRARSVKLNHARYLKSIGITTYTVRGARRINNILVALKATRKAS